jgi:imidazolonepropionase-like amidohydrolase
MSIKTKSFLLTSLIGVFLLWSCSKQQFDHAFAITHVTVIDGTGSPPRTDMTVLLSDDRIATVGSFKSTSVPKNVRILDATGKFLIPGLVDAHLHLTGSGEPAGSREFMLPLLLANGITTVRDMGGYLDSLTPLRKELENGRRLGPHILFAGPYLDGNPPSFQPSLVVTNTTEANQDVHTLAAGGVDFIKVQSVLSRDAYFAIAAACRREHISFVGHVPDRITAAEASDAGQKSIEHLTGVLRACSSDEPHLMREQLAPAPKNETPQGSHAREIAWEEQLLQTYSTENAANLIATFLRNQTWQVPTLILLRNDAYPGPQTDSLDDPLLKFVPRVIVKNWKQARQNEDQFSTPNEFALRQRLLDQSMSIVEEMQHAGMRIMAGTDSAAPFVIPGFALHQELALLVKAGLTPMQALQAATKNPADFLGKLKTQGTIESGKTADLVLLDADPLADIHNTQKIYAIILRGKLFNRAVLDEMLSSVEKFAASN